jgi:hypothetical protein
MTEKKRKYKPGTSPDKRGRVAESRVLWTRITDLEVVMYRKPPFEDSPELGNGIDIALSSPRQRQLSLRLTQWTREELESVRMVINRAFDEAAPICTQRDKVAQEEWEAGNDPYLRIYRPTPHIVDRSGPKPEHGKGIQG